MDFKELYSKYQSDIIKHTKELVSINSVCVENEVVDGITYKFGIGCKKALDYVLDLASKMGFKTKNIENVCGHVEYGSGDEIFAVLCHVDVVPAIGDWTKDPFECYEKDGLLYGRGTSDDKGPAIASLYALKCLKDLGFEPKKRIRLIYGTDEETGSRGLKRYLEVEENPVYGISPDADFPIIYGEKGILSMDIIGKNNSCIKCSGGARYNIVAPSVTFTCCDKLKEKIKDNKKVILEDGMFKVLGKSAHAMEPDNGLNAIKEMASILNEYTDSNLIHFINDKLMNSRCKLMGLDCTDPEMGDLTMNLGLIEMNDDVRLGLNFRYPKNLNYDKFISEFKRQANEYGLDIKVITNSTYHYIDPKSDYIQKLYKSYTKYTNDFTLPFTIGGGTYARDLKCGVAYGVLFPWDTEMAHETNEFINIESLIKAGVILTDAIYEMTKDKNF